MNTDHFENQLQRQPLRPVPAEWRGQILEAAQAAVASPARPARRFSSWWRELLWPSPWAWAGAAAVWALIFGLNNEAASGLPESEARRPAPPAAFVEMALAQRRVLMTSLFDPAPSESAIPPREPFRPRPRSEGRPECLCA